MCGITGFWDFKRSLTGKEMECLGDEMGQAIKSRGPDSSGVWSQEDIGLLFSHRRLAIQDLSPLGHQPMESPSGRFVIVYNGEVYNGPDLQKELSSKGYSFRGHSDTEVMLAAFEEWGLEESLRKFIGMFAFALWDKQEKKLFLVRDRLGIKPLYWGWQKGVLFFGSQIKSFYSHPAWTGTISKDALVSYFRFNYVPAPMSIYEDIEKLEPGHIVEISQDQSIQKKAYWSMEEMYKDGMERPYQGSFDEARDELEELLKDAIGKRMLSDVPLGAFLSGGVDSSTVAALMQAQSSRPIKTFSIGFNEAQFNEAQHAKQVAEHLGTEHHELYVTPKETQAVIPNLSEYYDEPFADSSQIPTYLVSQMAREHVTVALSGDGGDEFFAGYNRYLLGASVWKKVRYMPAFLRNSASKGLSIIPHSIWKKLEGLEGGRAVSNLSHKAQKLGDILGAENLGSYYEEAVSFWRLPEKLVVCGSESSKEFYPAIQSTPTMQLADSTTYLPDDILTKVDRASMAVSLEARVPLIDHRVVEFAWRLPLEMKIHQGKGKHILREVLYKYVPKELIERPKMGFGVPIDQWLRSDLKEWMMDLLSEDSLKQSGLINPEPILKRRDEHLSGKNNWCYSLWGVLMFQDWYRKLS